MPDPAPMTPGLPDAPAPMTPGLGAVFGPPASSLPAPSTPNVTPRHCGPPWNIMLTQPLAPPVSREAGCFFTFEAAHIDLAHGEILSSLIICFQVVED